MRVRAAADEQRRRLGEQAGVADEEVLRDLQELGYTPETVMLLHLVPLIQTAWAEGGVSQKERDLIVKAARSRGIAEGSPCRSAAEHVATERPSDELFEKSLRAIRTILQAQRRGRPRGQRERSALARHGHRRRVRRHRRVPRGVGRRAADSGAHQRGAEEKRQGVSGGTRVFWPSWRFLACSSRFGSRSFSGEAEPALSSRRYCSSVVCFRRLSLCSLPSASFT